MTALESLALKHGTDKASHGYCPHYEMLIGHLHLLPITMIEIGIGSGDSLRMWREWMPNAQIYGMDFNEYAPIDGVTIIKGNQNSTDDLDRMLSATGRLHLVIDDAGHNNSDQKICLEHIFPQLVVGGWYVIEDLNGMDDLKKFEFGGDVEELHMIGCDGHGWILFLKKR